MFDRKIRLLIAPLIVCLMFAPSVHGDEDSAEVSFVNDVLPVMTKAGCNQGACHAKAGGGQNGFQLSILGFEAADDHASIVKQDRGRRISPAAPPESLLLKKASGKLPHGGGTRLVPDSPGYEILKNWIGQGAPEKGANESSFVGVEVRPEKGLIEQGGTQQLTVIAKYADGTERDVTEFALFESNSSAMAEVTDEGLVTILDVPGKASVMVRYQGQAAVFSVAVPMGAPLEGMPTPKNFIDELVFANLQQLGIPPSEVCDDSTFLRRVTLDIAGRLPTMEETQAFLEDASEGKRDRVIDRLLASPGYADFFANKWTSLLKNRRDEKSDITSNFAFHAWMRDSLLANVSYDQIVRELLAATGTVVGNPPVAWYKRVKEPKEQIEDVAQLFLGVRLQCAQCHHHPFERWSQDDYYSLAAFFSQIGRKPTSTPGEDLIFHKRGIATAKQVKTGADLKPRALGDDVGDISPDEDPRLRLANWMGSPDNPFFAKALVNRYWKHFFKQGLIEPEDDIRDTNPPSNPELLAALEKHFVESGFDLKQLVRVISQSQAYQLSATPNQYNIADQQNFSRFYPRRMQAEVLLDSINDLTDAKTTFANLPPGTRAVALPDNSYNNASELLKVFGRPEGASVCECERAQSSSLAQSLHLINSNEVKGKLGVGNGRAQRLSQSEAPLDERIRELYLVSFSREPRPEETQAAAAYLQEPVLNAEGQPVDAKTAARQNWQDLVWALMNTKEFLFNH